MTEEELKALLELDSFGLLESKPSIAPMTRDEKLIHSFQEINLFVEKYGREPQDSSDVNELGLFFRLQGIRKNPQKIVQLKEFDKYSLLELPTNNTIVNALESDEYGLLDDDEVDITTLRNIPDSARETSDFIAKQKTCPNFEKYEPLFKQCQAELASGKRHLEKYNDRQRIEGQFFELGGVLVYIEKIYHLERGKDGKMDGRTRLIFENGKMSNMLLRSFTKRMYERGKHISDDKLKFGIDNPLLTPNEKDKPTGYIYVLSSKSRDNSIRSIKNLFKIGFSETTVEERIKNAAREPTYLMAPVKIVATYSTYNMNTQKFENLLHRFFDTCRVSIDVFDASGNRHTVREWFQIPFEDIETAIDLLISGDIVHYKYERDKGIVFTA